MKSLVTSLLFIVAYMAAAIAGAQTVELTTIMRGPKNHWIAGDVHGVKFTTSGLSPGTLYVNLIDAKDPSLENGFNISSTVITEDGNDGDAFTLPFDLPSGGYFLRLVAMSTNYPHVLFSDTSTNMIRVTSTITSPAKGSVLRAGHEHVMKWLGREPGADKYDVVLFGPPMRALGTVNAQQGWFKWKVPSTIPSGKYIIAMSGKQLSGANSDYFYIMNTHYGHDQFAKPAVQVR